MPNRDLDNLNITLNGVESLLAGVSDMGLSPEILKQLDDIEATLTQVELTIKDLGSIPSPVKDGLQMTLDKVHQSLAVIRLQYQSPVDSEGRMERVGIGGLPDIYLEEFSLHPATKEIVIDGETKRLSPAEFKVLYSLASRCGQEVNLGSSHTLLTRLSVIRRISPMFKSRIESLGGGKYVLNCKLKR